MATQILIKNSYNLGVQAFKKGKPCIPAFDKELTENILRDLKVGEGIPYLKAWIKGWTTENLRSEI